MRTDQTEKSRRDQLADRLAGRGRSVVWTVGGLAVLTVSLLMLFRPYVGRPLKIGSSGVVEQSAINCPPARTALTASFNKADASVPDEIRVCVETGRGKVFTAGLVDFFILLATWGASHLGQSTSRRGRGEESSRWDRAIARAKTNAEQPDERAG